MGGQSFALDERTGSIQSGIPFLYSRVSKSVTSSAIGRYLPQLLRTRETTHSGLWWRKR
jgi:serine kinase of HPr protein (carbohydrate metabolism regulator)